MFFFDAFAYIQATSMAFLLIALSAVLLRIPSHTSAKLPDEPKERKTHAHRHHAAEYAPATG
jgi:hypothetical protein